MAGASGNDQGMTDLDRARDFIDTHARLLDRRHLDVVLGGGAPAGEALLAALRGYRNRDGGFGWGLELSPLPDARRVACAWRVARSPRRVRRPA